MDYHNRLCIFSFYNKYGKVNRCVEYLLNELKTVSSSIVCVINGAVDDVGIKSINRYTDQIIIRENKGFDCGAYAYYLLNEISKEELSKYDELILCNDTFFGPLTPFKSIFLKMEEKKLDIWGLNIIERNILSHIQSFFLVFNRDTFMGADFWLFWNNIDANETDIKNIFGPFEYGLYDLFDGKYRLGSYVNTEGLDIYRCAALSCDYYGLPIIKKKAFDINYNSIDNQKILLTYIKENYKEYVPYIYDYLRSIGRKLESYTGVAKLENPLYAAISGLNIADILEWVDGSDFYIFGTGQIARGLYQLYFGDMSNCKGFVVSDNKKNEEFLFEKKIFTNRELESGVKIVLGVNRDVCKEIVSQLEEKFCVLNVWGAK